jgi:hypothetical protein
MPETRIPVPLRRALLVACCALCAAPVPALAAPSPTKVVRYHGYRVTVPRGWPVFDLARDRRVCVRFDRHAVYLGVPSAGQSCPARPAGRTEAILISPLGAPRGAALPSVSVPGAASAGGSEAGIVDRALGVSVTATWGAQRATVAHALGLGSRSLSRLAAAESAAPAPSPLAHETRASAVSPRERAHSSSPGASLPGGVYAGPGFDACSAPSTGAMSAWSSSYRAIGVYIGGAEVACSQPNLTASWVASESAGGWHLVPIYVGLQAPGNSCGCAAISSSSAASEGSAAASDAVAHAQALGLGTGNPIYYDMESYAPGGSRTSTVLAFLAAWTARLHAEGYLSGVYSSDSSGIADLVSQYGTGYPEPDEIWFAAWNGQASTADSTIPSSEWADQQRLHQYEGGHNETHGGVTINIDGDYLDAATAAAGSAATTAAAPPAASSPPRISGTVAIGQTLAEQHGSWSGQPTSYGYQWELCDTAGANCTPIAGAGGQSYTITSADAGGTLRVLESAANAAGSGAPASSAQTAVVPAAGVGGYLLYTAYGNIFNSSGATWYGSPNSSGWRPSDVAGLAPSADGRGYWLAESSGRVTPYGGAAAHPAIRPAHPVIGIAAAPGGYLLYTAYGNVYNSSGATWYGSPSAGGEHVSDIVGLAPTADGRGYWLIDAAGHVYAYGDAATHPAIRPAHPVIGIATVPGGYLLYTAYGNIYNSAGAGWYGSPNSSGWHPSDVAGLAPTADGRGYWLVESSGRVTPYGDAVAEGSVSSPHPITGIVAP